MLPEHTFFCKRIFVFIAKCVLVFGSEVNARREGAYADTVARRPLLWYNGANLEASSLFICRSNNPVEMPFGHAEGERRCARWVTQLPK
jgi:hypothetical protein